MELISNGITVNSNTPKIIETPEHFIINTQLYDKQTLKPVPMKFNTNIATLSSVPYITLNNSIDTYYYFSTNYFHCHNNENNEFNNDKLIQDKEDPNIFYLLKKYNSDEKILFYRIQYNQDTKKYNITHYIHSGNIKAPYNGKGDMNIIYETDEYFVLKSSQQHYTQYTLDGTLSTSIFKVRKKDFNIKTLVGSGSNPKTYYYTHFLAADNDIVYIYTIDSNDYRKIIKINLSSDVITNIWDYTSNNGNCINCNPIEINGYYYSLCSYKDTNNNNLYKLMKLSLDMSNDTVSYELLDINLNNFTLDSSPANNLSHCWYMQYTLRKIITNNNIYLSCLIHQTGNMEIWQDKAQSYQCKLSVFSLDGNTVNVLSSIPLTDGCRGSLIYNDSKHLILYISNCILFYTFNETKTKYVLTYKKAGIFKVVGIDSLNRIITQTTDDTIEMLTDTNACILQADFAEELYDKDDSSKIDTTVSFYAKNFLDEYLETNVKLTLTGPVVFKENNEKTLVTSTLKTGLRTVPVTITGYGNIEVIITQNT